MAYYALHKWFAPWSKVIPYDVIYWYKEYYLKTPERRAKEKEIRSRKAKAALAAMYSIIDVYGRHFI